LLSEASTIDIKEEKEIHDLLKNTLRFILPRRVYIPLSKLSMGKNHQANGGIKERKIK
jgi:hypothetical protein